MGNQSIRSSEDIEAVLRRYANMVYRLALTQTKRKADADDVFQEVFLRLVVRERTFESEEHLKAWLIRVTINCSRKWFRAARLGRLLSLDHEPAQADAPGSSEVLEAVMALPRQYRTVIHLFYYEDLSIARISEILQIPESTIKSQLARARRMLRKHLEEEMADV